MSSQVPSTVFETRDRIRSGELSALDATTEALRQIDAVNPELDAVSQVFHDEAIAAAKEIDRRIAAHEDLGELAGVPFTVKENICTREGSTNAGSRILDGH